MKAAAIRHGTCERDFVYKSLKQGIRLDGRQSHDYRDISVEFGKSYGHADVKLGDTRTLAQVSCEIVKPRESRPSDGQLHINVDLSPMASPAFENGRMSDYGIEINRILERCLKESKAVDLESLCLVAGQKVWSVRVDVFVLNDAGNVVDCACIASIAALANFRRPDVTVSSNEITIHSAIEKEYIPLNVHHMPICTTYGFVDNGEQVIIDPEEKEEGVTTGHFTVATNIHHEICCAHVSGELTLDVEQILQCTKVSLVKSNDITEIIKTALQKDIAKRAPPRVEKKRLKDPPIRPTNGTKTIAEPTRDKPIEDIESLPTKAKLTQGEIDALSLQDITVNTSANGREKQPVENLGRGTAIIGDSKSIPWEDLDCDGEKDSLTTLKSNTRVNSLDNDLDSEEEETRCLHADALNQVTMESSDTTLQSVNSENKPPVGNSSNQVSGKKKKKKKRKLVQK